MDNLRFEWDETKNQINIKKHGVSFETAKSVFYDENAVLFDDPDHSFEEERFLIIGYAEDSDMYIVSHCYRYSNDAIRIISARAATAKEKNFYYDFGKR